MSSEFSDHDGERPDLRPVPTADRDLRSVNRAPRQRRPGFGFWMAALWSLLYFAVSQLVAGPVFLVLFIGIALAPEIREHGLAGALESERITAWMQGSRASAAIVSAVGATQFAGLFLSWLLFRLTVGKSWKRKIALTRRPSATHVVLILLWMPAFVALGAAVEVPIKKFIPSAPELLERVGIRLPGMEGAEETIGRLVGQSPWLLALFVVGVSPAICEEVFCRGFLGLGLSGRYRSWVVVLIVSFLFGCLHADPQQGPGTMCLALAIHGAYLATRSLLVPMIIHCANNSIAVVHIHPKLFPVLDPFEHAMTDSPLLFVGSAMLLFGAICYALYQTRCKLVSVNDGLVWEPAGVSSVELPPPTSGTVVTHDPLSGLSVVLVLIGAVVFGLVLSFA